MAGVRVRLDRRGMEDLLTGSEVSEALGDIAKGVAGRAQSGAPVATGAYRDSIESEVTTANDLGITYRRSGGNRAAAVVVAKVPYAAGVEGRTGNLKRALGGA